MGKHKGSKVLDTEVMSTYCHSCAQMTNENVKLTTLCKPHDSKFNHSGSAGKIETDRTVKILAGSIDINSLTYAEYLGNGTRRPTMQSVMSKFMVSDKKLNLSVLVTYRNEWERLLDLVNGNRNKKFVVDMHGKWLANMIDANKSKGEKLYSGIVG